MRSTVYARCAAQWAEWCAVGYTLRCTARRTVRGTVGAGLLRHGVRIARRSYARCTYGTVYVRYCVWRRGVHTVRCRYSTVYVRHGVRTARCTYGVPRRTRKTVMNLCVRMLARVPVITSPAYSVCTRTCARDCYERICVILMHPNLRASPS